MKTFNQFQVLRREKKPKLEKVEVIHKESVDVEMIDDRVEVNDQQIIMKEKDAADIYKITEIKSFIKLEIFKESQFELEGNIELTLQQGQLQVSGKDIKQGEKVKIYASVNHITLNAKEACIVMIEKLNFDFNVKLLKELDREFRISLSRDILATRLSTKSNISVVIGPVNSGKSTTARYLTNLYLNKNEVVAFLDCDLGQPEFTPPGMISLTLVKDPLLGHPCTHLQMPKHSIFIGDTTAKRDPDSYITGLYKLVDIYKREFSGIPLVVNTSGWTRGIGFDLLRHFINYLNPETAIFMENEKSFPPQHLLDTKQLSEISVMRLPAPDTLSKLMTNPLSPLAQQLPYKVAFGDIKIKFFESQVPYSQSLYALNGSIVALIIDSTTYHSQTQSSNLNFVPTHTPLDQQCVGLGLIKAISKVNKCFYILTPVDPVVLENVNLIVKGGLEMTGMVGERGLLPYTALGTGEGIGSGEVKTRHLGRKRGLQN